MHKHHTTTTRAKHGRSGVMFGGIGLAYEQLWFNNIADISAMIASSDAQMSQIYAKHCIFCVQRSHKYVRKHYTL